MTTNDLRTLLTGWARRALGGTVAHAAGSSEADLGFIRVTPDDVQWVEDADGSGMQRAVISGDPSQPGLYVIRVKFPRGTMSRNHFHREERHATVISGTWYTGTGDDFDPSKTIPLKPGSYMRHPAGAHHFDGAKEEDAVVQIIGIGPSETTRVRPELGGYGPSL